MQNRLMKILLALLTIGVWGLLLCSVAKFHVAEAQSNNAAQPDLASQIIRARGLTIVDENNRERIFIGSVPDPKEGKRKDPMTGITINDPAGFERFGVGLNNDGTMQLGLDAPPKTGDDRNRERIHLIADSEGGAMIRFLNKKTSVPGWIRLGDDGRLYLEFIDVQRNKKKVVTRQIGLTGDKNIEEPLN